MYKLLSAPTAIRYGLLVEVVFVNVLFSRPLDVPRIVD